MEHISRAPTMLGWDAHLLNTKDLACGNNSFPISHCEFSEAVPTYTTTVVYVSSTAHVTD